MKTKTKKQACDRIISKRLIAQAALKYRACSPAIEWLKKKPRTYRGLKRYHRDWAVWAYSRGLLPEDVASEWAWAMRD